MGVRDAAYRIVEGKGYTSFGIATAIVRICQAVVRDERAVLPVSTWIDREYGVTDICLSLPCLIGAAGISAFPMAARVVQRVAQEEDFENFPLVKPTGFREYDARWWFGIPGNAKAPELNLLGVQQLCPGAAALDRDAGDFLALRDERRGG